MTARCLDRARDIGLRRAIGARTRDIVALLLTEHALLFLAGAALGTAAAVPLLRLVVALLPPTLHLLKPPVFDVRVAAFVALAVILTLFLASLWPIRRALKPDLQQLVTGPGGTAVTLRTSGWGTWIVTTGQVTGTIVLVVAGGLLVGSLLEVKANAVGYRIDDVVVAELAFTPWVDGNLASSRRPEIKIRLDRFLDELRPIPGVLAAGAADVGVLESSLAYASRFDPVNPARPPDASHPPGTFWVGESGGLKIPVTPGFFRAAGMAPIAGRLPTDDELRSGAPVVAISRSYAREHYAGRDPIGEQLRHQPARDYPTFEIVGVVEDPRLARWDVDASSSVFTSYATFGGNADPVLFVHAGGSIDTVMAEIIRRADAQRPMLRPVRVQTASVALNDTIRERRLQSWLFGSFAVAGLVLAGVGLFGFVAMTMARRTREIGIRMALGATRERLVTGLVSEQIAPVLIGLIAGAVLAAWAVRFLEAYVYELSLYDARVWIAALVVVGATAVAGALIPSLRGSRVDPVRALRVE
jgi:predicted permease